MDTMGNDTPPKFNVFAPEKMVGLEGSDPFVLGQTVTYQGAFAVSFRGGCLQSFPKKYRGATYIPQNPKNDFLDL